MSFGRRIKQIRTQQSLTQVEFSKRICVSQPHLSKVEHDEEKLSKPVIRLISLTFDISEEWINTGVINVTDQLENNGNCY